MTLRLQCSFERGGVWEVAESALDLTTMSTLDSGTLKLQCSKSAVIWEVAEGVLT